MERVPNFFGAEAGTPDAGSKTADEAAFAALWIS
jgi:hypothetical protein